jgi:hypothetical protein
MIWPFRRSKGPHGSDDQVLKRRLSLKPGPHKMKPLRGEPYRVRIVLNGHSTLAEHGYVTMAEAQAAAKKFAAAFEPDSNVTVKIVGPT